MGYSLIGIAGGTCAGKSTLAERLLRRLGKEASLIHLDAYFRPNTPTHNRPEAIDKERLLADLDKLLAGETLHLTHKRLNLEWDVPARPFVIIEGHLLFCFPEVRERLALSVFVDLDDDERAIRRLDRNVNTQHLPFHEVAQWYLKDAKSGHELFIAPTKRFADLIVWGDLKERSVAKLLSVIRSLA